MRRHRRLHSLAKQHDVDRSLIRLWVRKYEGGEFDAEVEAAKTLHEYEAKIAQLERKVGQLTMELDFLKGALAQARSASGAPTSILVGPGACPSNGRVDS